MSCSNNKKYSNYINNINNNNKKIIIIIIIPCIWGSGEGSTTRNFIVCNRSPNIVRVIKSRRLRWAGHVARMEEGSAFKILTGKPI